MPCVPVMMDSMQQMFPDHTAVEQPRRLRTPGWVWAAFVGAAVAYSALGALLLLTFRQPAFDIGIYDQTIWLLAHGGHFNTVAGIHVWGAHFSPFLWLLTPLADLPGGALGELIFQATWVSAGVFPAYLLGRHVGKPGLFGLIYLAHPGISSALGFGFHPYTLAAPLLMALAYLIVCRRPPLLVAVTTAAILPMREDMALWVLLILGMGVAARRLSLTPALIIGGVAVTYGAVVLRFVLPGLSPTGSYLFETSFGEGDLGSFDWRLLAVTQVSRLAILLLPLGAAAVRANWRLVAIAAAPMVGLVLRSGVQEGLLKPVFHYEALFVPLLLAAVALGSAAAMRWRASAVAVIGLTLVFGVLRPWPMFGEEARLGIDADVSSGYAELTDLTSSILGENDSIAVPRLMVPHFSERSRIFVWPYPFDRQFREPYPMDCPHPQVVVAPESSPYPNWENARRDYVTRATVGSVHIYELVDAEPAAGGCGPAS